MNHSFNIEIAKQFGMEAAVILENLAHWTHWNIANNKNCIDGKFWIYNSRRAWHVLFPYISERTIARVLERLEKNGILISGNYNKAKYDHTKWYAFADDVLLDRYFKIGEKYNKILIGQNDRSILPECPTNDTKLTDQSSQNDRTIPNIITNIKPNIDTIPEAEQVIKKPDIKIENLKIPPAIDDVKSYISDKGYGFTAEAWYDYYAARGWRLKTGKMIDWRAAVRTWAHNENKYSAPRQVPKTFSQLHDDDIKKQMEAARERDRKAMAGGTSGDNKHRIIGPDNKIV